MVSHTWYHFARNMESLCRFLCTCDIFENEHNVAFENAVNTTNDCGYSYTCLDLRREGDLKKKPLNVTTYIWRMQEYIELLARVSACKIMKGSNREFAPLLLSMGGVVMLLRIDVPFLTDRFDSIVWHDDVDTFVRVGSICKNSWRAEQSTQTQIFGHRTHLFARTGIPFHLYFETHYWFTISQFTIWSPNFK